MSMIGQINIFVDTMLEQRQQFEKMQNTIVDCNTNVKNVLAQLENHVQELVSSAKSAMAEDKSTADIFTNASNSLVTAMNDANHKILEASKGMVFMKDFEKHFTVAIFGKVKAGKSYIGNFVMGNAVKKAGLASSYDKLEKIKVHVYDRGKESTQDSLSEQTDDDGGFKTDMREATSTIQWFDLGGMSWFDTPGIGSVTWENEMLAKEYVQNADLVIFACNSDAAGTRPDFAEMKQLYDSGKPILLLVTQSDTTESDWDDETDEDISVLVPKTDKDRQDVEQYMIKELKKQNIPVKYDILTVSAKLGAEALLENDETMFEQSNMGKFLEKLTNITKSDAADLKRATPKKRINDMLESVIKDLQSMVQEISAVCQSTQASREDLLDREANILEQVKSKVYMKLCEMVQDYKLKVERDRITVGETELADSVNEIICGCVDEVCANEAIQSINRIQKLDITLSGIGDLKVQQESIPYEYSYVIDIPRPPKGILEKLGAKFLHKEYHSSTSKTKTKYSTFDTGINDTEIMQNIVLKLDDVFRNAVQDYINNLVTGYYQPIEDLQKSCIVETQKAMDALSALKIEC